MQQKNLIAPLIVAAIVVAGGSFYGGMQYQKSQQPTQQQGGGQRGGGNGGLGRGMGGGRGAGGGFISGEVLAKDAQSITVKLRDGSSKIIFVAPSTAVGKMDAGSISDVVQGSQVTIIGATNTDGSVTANNIQIRPEGMMQPPRGGDNQPATSTTR
jgi:hypothetical protein